MPLKINGSVLSMLPGGSISAQYKELNDAFIDRIDRQLVFLIKTKDNNTDNIDLFVNSLKETGYIDNIRYRINKEKQDEYARFFYTYRNALIDGDTQKRLEAGAKTYIDFILSEIYSSFSLVGGEEIRNDPLFLTRSRVKNINQLNSKIQIRDEYLSVSDIDGQTYYFIHATHNLGSFDIKQSESFVLKLNEIFDDFSKKGCLVLYRGAIFYSFNASNMAQDDIYHLGFLTVFLIFILIFIIFRSVYPIVLTLVSIGFGALVGFCVSYIIFEEIHLITMVMAVSIIGISADYSIYYATQRFINEINECPFQSAKRIRKTLFFALSTIIISYLILTIAPFSSIRQLSVFAVSGLVASCFSALYIGPYICSNVESKKNCFSCAVSYLKIFESKKFTRSLIIFSMILSVFGIYQIRINDDVAALQKLPQHLVNMEKKISELTGQRSDQKLILITSENDELLLQNYEKLEVELNKSVDEGIISGFVSFPVRSILTQNNNIKLIKEIKSDVVAALNELGVNNVNYDSKLNHLTIERFIRSEAGYGFDMMYLSLNDVKALIIPVYDVSQSSVFKKTVEKVTGAYYIDRKESLEELFSFYRTVISYLIVFVILCITVANVIRLGVKRSIRAVSVTVISLLLSISSIGVCGYELNLFTTLALVLVIGIGINYVAFFTNYNTGEHVAFVSSTLAMMTTIFTLGILVFSQTEAISGFGLVITIGVIANYIFAPLARVNNDV